MNSYTYHIFSTLQELWKLIILKEKPYQCQQLCFYKVNLSLFQCEKTTVYFAKLKFYFGFLWQFGYVWGEVECARNFILLLNFKCLKMTAWAQSRFPFVQAHWLSGTSKAIPTQIAFNSESSSSLYVSGFFNAT